MKPLVFTTERGRNYDGREVVGVVLRCVRSRWGSALEVPQARGWRARVRAKLADEAWLRTRNGQTPGSLAKDLDAVVFGAE